VNRVEKFIFVLLVIVALVSVSFLALTFSTDIGTMELLISEALKSGLRWAAVVIALGLVVFVIIQVRRN